MVAASESGLLCTLTNPVAPLVETCAVTNPNRAVDGSSTTAASLQYAVGLLDPLLGGSVQLTVDLPGPVAAGAPAAFVLDIPGATIIRLDLLESITISTALNGSLQETATGTGTLALDLLGLVGGTSKAVVGFLATKPYNQIAIRVSSSVLSLNLQDAVRVYEPCLSLVAAP